MRSPDGGLRLLPYACGYRWCPECAARWSDQLRARLGLAVERIRPRELRHIVLTIPNPPTGALAEGVSQLYRARREWTNEGRRGKRPWLDERGLAWKVEVHWSRRSGWHPHLHLLLHQPGGIAMRNGDPAREAWARITARYGDGAAVGVGSYVTAPRDAQDAAKELAKYAAKPIALKALNGDRIAELAAAMHRRHWAAAHGTLDGRRPEDEAGEPDEGWEFLGLASMLVRNGVGFRQVRPASEADRALAGEVLDQVTQGVGSGSLSLRPGDSMWSSLLGGAG